MNKSLSSHPRAAFTLIELLVVISIITVLAGLSFPAFAKVLSNAKKVQARSDMNNIVNAVKFYYSEYGRYPISSTAQAAGDLGNVYGIDAAHDNSLVINVLRCPNGWVDDAANPLNSRKIAFLSDVPIAKDQTRPRSGVLNAGANRGAWFDPWGFEYLIFIDADYNGDIDASAVYNSGLSVDPTSGKVQTSIGAASMGFYNNKNKVTPNPTTPSVRVHAFASSTDLISWQ